MPLPAKPRVVVTGAGSGLGRAFCVELASRGARILATDINAADAAATVALCGGGEAHALQCDVTRVEELVRVADEAEARFGGVDLVINNAGVGAGGLVGAITVENWHWLIDIDLYGPIYGCHVFVPRLRKQGSGHILNVASAAGLLSPPMMAPYNVAKAGVVSLSETLYAELAGSGVGVSVLCPTWFKTNIAASSRGVDEKFKRSVQGFLEKGDKNGSAADIARAALAGVEAGELHIVPQADGRWFWRLKRLFPQRFQELATKAIARQTKKLGLT